MSKIEISPEQLKELQKIEAINLAAGKVAWASFKTGIPISELWFFIKTTAAKELERLNSFKQPEYVFRNLKTVLPDKIETIEQAKAYLTDLFKNDESYSIDENAADSLNLDEETGRKMDALRDQIYALQNKDFDACGYLLALCGHIS